MTKPTTVPRQKLHVKASTLPTQLYEINTLFYFMHLYFPLFESNVVLYSTAMMEMVNFEFDSYCCGALMWISVLELQLQISYLAAVLT